MLSVSGYKFRLVFGLGAKKVGRGVEMVFTESLRILVVLWWKMTVKFW